MTDRPFRIVVPGQPIAQPRHRSRVVAGRAQLYVPARHPVREYRQAIELLARRHFQREPFDKGVSLRLDLQLVFSRPKAMTRKTRPNPRAWHTARPDADNVCKAVKDALSGIVYHDDSQVAVEQVAKFYAAGGEQPHTEIRLRELT